MEDYKIRLVNEYKQLKERTDKLCYMLDRWLMNDLDFVPSCSFHLLETQYHIMKAYLNILEQRAEIDNITINSIK